MTHFIPPNADLIERGVIGKLILRLSIWRGCRRQRIAREIRSADVKRGIAKSLRREQHERA